MKHVRIRTRSGKKGKSYQVIGPCPKTGKELVYGTFRRKHEAEARAVEVRDGLYNMTEFGKRRTKTFADLADAFIKDYEDRHRQTVASGAWDERWSVSGDTLRNYQDTVRRFLLPTLGPITLIALGFEDCQKLIAKLQQDTTAAQTRKAGETLRVMLRWGDKQGWKVEPRLLTLLSELRLPPKGKRTNPPTIEQMQRIFAVLYGPRASKVTRQGYLYRRALFLLFITNGPRRGEVAALRWENIDRQKGIAVIDRSWSRFDGMKSPKTKAGVRPLSLARQTLEALDDIWEFTGQPEEGLVFAPKTGETIYGGMYNAYLKPVLAEAGLLDESGKALIHFHLMRHGFNSLQASMGVSTKARQVEMGHSDPRVTEGPYLHLMPGNSEVREAANGIANELVPMLPAPDAMELKKTGYHSWAPEKRREYHRQYMRDRRAREREEKAESAE